MYTHTPHPTNHYDRNKGPHHPSNIKSPHPHPKSNPATHPIHYHRNKGLEYYYAEEDEEERARAEARLAPMGGEQPGLAVRGVVMKKVRERLSSCLLLPCVFDTGREGVSVCV